MAYRQYIGARYVPKFADPIDWDDQTFYEALTIVKYNLGYYTSKKNVPVGVAPTNTEYWVITGNYSEQMQELINKFPIDTSDIADGAVTFDKLDDDIIPVYDATLLGAVGNGSTDNYQMLQTLATQIKNSGGGVLYLRSGVYKISKTLIIGDNVRLIGDGKSSVLKYTETPTIWGVGLLVLGSNVLVKDLKVEYPVTSAQPTLTGSNNGAVAASTYDYDEAIVYTQSYTQAVTTFSDYDNIVFDNVYTNGWYPLQIEPTQNKTISNAVYRNMYFDHDALVSVFAGTNGGKIENAVIENVTGGYLRLVGDANNEGAIINNCIFNYGYIHASGVKAVNLKFDATETSIFDTVDFNWILNLGSTTPSINMSSFVNLDIDGASKKNLGITTNANTYAEFINVNVKNCLTHSGAGATGEKIFIVNGWFETANGIANTLCATGINVHGNTQDTSLARYVFDDKAPTVIVPTGLSFLEGYPNDIYSNGNIVKLSCGIHCPGASANTIILRVTTAPHVQKYIIGMMKETDGIVPTILSIDTTGVIKIVGRLDGGSISGVTDMYIDSCYTVKATS